MPEKFVLVDDLSIRCWTNEKAVEEGKPVIVLFHGNAFSLDNWKQIGTLDELSKLGYPVLAVDLPIGKGSKSQKISGASFKKHFQLVTWLDKIFLSIGLEESVPLVIVGPSLGGGVALSYALAHPQRISALILIAPALGQLDEVEKEKISELDIPVLLLWGDRDDVFPLGKYGRQLKEQLPRSKLLILSNAGHAAYLDKPEEFHEIVSDFLTEAL